jgi:hypothetical protein
MHPVGTVPGLCTVYVTAPRLKSNSASDVKENISGKFPIMWKHAWVLPHGDSLLSISLLNAEEECVYKPDVGFEILTAATINSYVVQSGRSTLIFRRNALPPSSGQIPCLPLLYSGW